MEVPAAERGSTSPYNMSNMSSSEAVPIAEGILKATPESSVSQDNDAPSSAERPEGNEKEPAKGDAKLSEDAHEDGGPAIPNESEEEDETNNPQSASDSDSDASGISKGLEESVVRRAARVFKSASLLQVYKQRLEEQALVKGRKSQTSNLVKGVVDYLRVLENRLDELEGGRRSKVNKNDGEKVPTQQRPESGDSTVEVTVKFFNSAAYLGEDGVYPKLEEEPEKGTFMCGQDSQHLIRVLYSKARDDGVSPREEADSEPPDADNIDILTFGVTSEAVTMFFAKQLDIETEGGNLIRFGKPFRPLLRSLAHVREQLTKLQNTYGRVATEEMDQSQPARDSSSEARDATTNREESDVSPFAPAEKSKADGIQPFDRPAALPHFQAFLAFVDKYLGQQIQLYERFREGKETHVAFENLWMLFDANDTIYCPLRDSVPEEYINIEDSDHTTVRRHTPQAYRVVATSGGMPLASTMAPAFTMKGADESVGPVSFSSSLIMNAGVKAVADMLTQRISRRIRNNYTEFNLYCFYVDFDGIEYGTVREVFVFKPYEREIEIRSLQAYPVRYMSHDKLLLDRGNSFLDATRISHLQYEGLTVGPNREEINSPVVVDVKLAFEGGIGAGKAFIRAPEFASPARLWLPDSRGEAYDLFGKSKCSQKWCYSPDCTSNVYISSQKKQRHKIESDIKVVLEEYESEKQGGKEGQVEFKQLMEGNDITRLLPGEVPGFALRNRKWVLLNLTQLGPVEQDNEWDNLVLPPGHREMVQAMVETHTQDLGSKKDAKIGMDLVRGKGRGCIILLHGVPGVGKTSTAECVAAHTKKPLYPITCGDIGYRPEDVERNMENHFKLAHKWGCVLLLDEADVFLAKRDQKDVQRNGLVSVFLRILEYYSGILFLTTNRVGAIDDAFRSRLHLTLYYPKLTKKQTKEIFKHNFARVDDVNVDRERNGLPPFRYKESEQKIMDWAKNTWKTLRWNGRQIRNTFQTVLALAEFHAKKRSGESASLVVTKKHFKIVANASIQFNEYLLATHGADEDKVAKREYMRAMGYSPSSELVFKGFDQEDSDSSSEEDNSSDGSDSDSDDSDESDGARRKKNSKSKKGKESKSSSKKSKKASDKKGKSEKKSKEKKKDKKEKDADDDSD